MSAPVPGSAAGAAGALSATRTDVEAFQRYLREHNLPVTAQRVAIADVVLGSSQHLSAEEVARELARRGDSAGTATVYRTLELLVRSGLAVERDFGEGFKRFEPARDAPHHEHLICTVCGTVREFRDERLERMTTLMAESHGYARERHRLVIYGVCADCQRGRPPRQALGTTSGRRDE